MRQDFILIGLATVVVSLIITLNMFLQQNYQAEMAGQFNRQQVLLATTISGNLENTFAHMRDSLVGLSGLMGRRGPASQGLSPLTNAYLNRPAERGIKTSLMVFGRGGALIYKDPGAGDASPLDFELAEKTKTLQGGQSLFSDEHILREKTVKLYTPVRSGDGRWQGALGLGIDIESINSKLLDPIRGPQQERYPQEEGGYAWMMSEDGTLLYHPRQPGMIGKNLHKAGAECMGCHRSFDTELMILKSKEAGASSYVAPLGEDKLIAFSKADIFGRKWIICVSTPYSEVTSSIRKSLKLHSALVLAIFGATAAGAAAIIIINRKRVKAEERAKREEELEKYASLLEKTVGERTTELSAEKEKLSSIVNAIGGGLVLTDEAGTITWANSRFEAMAGPGVTGSRCQDILPGCPAPNPASNKAETKVAEGLFGQKGRHFQVTSAPVRSEDKTIGFIRLVQDVTEMRKMEEQMLHSERLSSLGRLTAGIAHEIGNPLTAVFSFLQILRDMEKEDFKKESLDTVIFHINRIADTVRQLSSLSKIPPPELKEANINSVVRQAIALMRYDKRAANIELREALEELLPPVTTDENQISQVFINLILNAVDAMPGGGTLTIKSALEEDAIAVGVEDTGVGIPKENLARVFDPFFTTKEKGTGLGLSVSYGIMRRLGGDIRVESTEAEGSRFTVIIPLRAKG